VTDEEHTQVRVLGPVSGQAPGRHVPHLTEEEKELRQLRDDIYAEKVDAIGPEPEPTKASRDELDTVFADLRRLGWSPR
jgi:hypothetical protein